VTVYPFCQEILCLDSMKGMHICLCGRVSSSSICIHSLLMSVVFHKILLLPNT